MGVGGSIFLLALGAVLTFAVKVSVAGLDLRVVGLILMAAGVIGLLLFLSVFGSRARRETVVRDETVYREPGVRDRDVY